MNAGELLATAGKMLEAGQISKKSAQGEAFTAVLELFGSETRAEMVSQPYGGSGGAMNAGGVQLTEGAENPGQAAGAALLESLLFLEESGTGVHTPGGKPMQGQDILQGLQDLVDQNGQGDAGEKKSGLLPGTEEALTKPSQEAGAGELDPDRLFVSKQPEGRASLPPGPGRAVVTHESQGNSKPAGRETGFEKMLNDSAPDGGAPGAESEKEELPEVFLQANSRVEEGTGNGEVQKANQLYEPDAEPSRVERLGEIVRSQAARGGGRVRVRLHPPELGGMLVDVSVQDDKVSVQLRVETVQAQDVLLNELPGLREAMGDRGLSVDTADVFLNTSGEEPGGEETSWGGNGGSQGGREEEAAGDEEGTEQPVRIVDIEV